MGMGFIGFLLKSSGASSFGVFSGVAKGSWSKWLADNKEPGPLILACPWLEKSNGDSCLIGVDVAITFDDTIGDCGLNCVKPGGAMQTYLCGLLSSGGNSKVKFFFFSSPEGDASRELWRESSDFRLRDEGRSDSLSVTLFMSSSLALLCSEFSPDLISGASELGIWALSKFDENLGIL
jgi:hypothetical protein